MNSWNAADVVGATVAEGLSARSMGVRAVPTAAAFDVPAAMAGASGGVRTLLRLEGLIVFAGALIAYQQAGAGWGAFALLFLLPDLSLLGYMRNPRFGAMAYNAAHSTIGPAAAIAIGVLAGQPVAMAIGLIWLAHIGFDRMLGYGLKYGSTFRATHLGRIGKRDAW